MDVATDGSLHSGQPGSLSVEVSDDAFRLSIRGLRRACNHSDARRFLRERQDGRSDTDSVPATVAGSTRHEMVITQADGTEHTFEVYGWSHEIISPRDAASGLPTGKRQHKPVSITKPIDKSTPLFMKALIDNELFKSAVLTSYRDEGSGETVYRTLMLTDPWVSTRGGMGDTRGSSTDHEDREHVSFTYQKITWTFEDGGVTHEDSWAEPR